MRHESGATAAVRHFSTASDVRWVWVMTLDGVWSCPL